MKQLRLFDTNDKQLNFPRINFDPFFCTNWRKERLFRKRYVGFTDKLRLKIKKRDGFRCQAPNCGVGQSITDNNLLVHHINGFKWENHEWNLITLCNKCHSSIPPYQYYWMLHYQKVIIQIYNKTWIMPILKKVVEEELQMKFNY